MNRKMKLVEKEFNKILDIINSQFDEKYNKDSLGIFFRKSDGRDPAGTYVYWDEKGYHKDSVGDRGGIVNETIYKNLKDICFELCEYAVGMAAIEYEVCNRKKNEDGRRIIFVKQLEVLKIIDYEFYLRGKEKIKKILAENPYDDNVGRPDLA